MNKLNPTENSVVAATAKQFGLPHIFILAMIEAEGGTSDTFLKAVRCSIPTCQDFAKAVEIACRTVAHRAFDFAGMAGPDTFIKYLASFWAPVGVANDPTNLNANWAKNVTVIYKGYAK